MTYAFASTRDFLVSICAIGSSLVALLACDPTGSASSKEQCLSAPEPLITATLEGAVFDGECTVRLGLETGHEFLGFACTADASDCLCVLDAPQSAVTSESELILLFPNRSLSSPLDVELTQSEVTSDDGCNSWQSYDDLVILPEDYTPACTTQEHPAVSITLGDPATTNGCEGEHIHSSGEEPTPATCYSHDDECTCAFYTGPIEEGDSLVVRDSSGATQEFSPPFEEAPPAFCPGELYRSLNADMLTPAEGLGGAGN
jgi:hypothetical protein